MLASQSTAVKAEAAGPKIATTASAKNILQYFHFFTDIRQQTECALGSLPNLYKVDLMKTKWVMCTQMLFFWHKFHAQNSGNRQEGAIN